MTPQPGRREPGRAVPVRPMLYASGLAVTALLVAACGGGSSSAAAGSASSPSPSSSAAPNRGNFANFNAVSGKVTAISAAGASVQPTTGDATTVAWASSTQFSKVSSVSLSSLAKGDCVMVASAGTNSGATPTTITAKSVSVTSTSGCSQRTGGFGGGNGFGGGGTAPSGRPSGGNSGQPVPAPTGSPGRGLGGRGFGNRGFGAFGTIASISASSFVVTSTFGATTTTTVKTTSATTVTATASATSSALVTGVCASAVGTKTSNGTIDARSITISTPSNGKCVAAGVGGLFGGRGFGFGRGGPRSGSPPPVTSA